MALSPFPLNLNSALSSTPLSSYTLFFPLPQPRSRSRITSKTLKIKPCCSYQTTHIEDQPSESTQVAVHDTPRKKQKPRPSFYQQVQEKWSRRIKSPREKYPWQIDSQQEQREQEEAELTQSAEFARASESEAPGPSPLKESKKQELGNRLVSAPWAHGGSPRKTKFVSEAGISKSEEIEVDKTPTGVRRGMLRKSHSDIQSEITRKGDKRVITNSDGVEVHKTPIGVRGGESIKTHFNSGANLPKESDNNLDAIRKVHENFEIDNTQVGIVKGDSLNDITSLLEDLDDDRSGFMGVSEQNQASSVGDSEGVSSEERDGWKKKSNTEAAESKIPAHELQRLRRVSLRMLERIKVGAAGITQPLVDSIHEKWKVDEVVKLKFEGPPALNMRKIHEKLESRTGGLVIWRSGTSVVLYRGMTYNLDCVKQYAKQLPSYVGSSGKAVERGRGIGVDDSEEPSDSPVSSFEKHSEELPEDEVEDMNEFDRLVDDLGPRFEDWSGRPPLPVDADLLPSVVPGYQPPFRLLPYGTKQGLQNNEMTNFRRLARRMPPHFALGRNRELQGLAVAMAKLWEGSALAKIAIKRGVQNTCNDRMAEELRKLTGGTLLSRNKEYIVFYRGNDFLPPRVANKLTKRRKLRDLRQDEEEQARMKASTLVNSNVKPSKGLLVAGTLAETKAATSRWGSQPSSTDIEKMMRESASARHALLVRYLEKKLVRAKEKMKQAEKALAKVQKDLVPAELPSDLETITDEERFLFRKIGLSMKPYLLLGRRGIFDGVVENMHLHWKYREVVKILVKRKNFAQLKHIAISLEAESGGVLVSLDKTTKGVAIIFYRGKNYQRPSVVRPKNLLSKRQALAQSVELQRREALKYHIFKLQEEIESLKSQLDDTTVKEIDEETLMSIQMNDDDDSVDDEEEDTNFDMHDGGSNEKLILEEQSI